MKDELFNAVRVTPSTKIRFKCTGCAECCRHVKESVPVNSLDVFYLTKYLRDTGLDICCTDEFLAQFATVALLDDCGYFMYFLKSVGEDDSCIFLNENRCSVQPAKPMACRLYPFMVDTNGSGGFRYLYSREREHHFCGPVVETRKWMKKCFQREARAFMQADFADTVPIARLLRSIPEHGKNEALFHFHRLRYSEYNLDRPFLEQFLQNQKQLLIILGRMAEKTT